MVDEMGFTKESAIERAAQLLTGVCGYSFDSIERYYDEYQRLARQSNENEILSNGLFSSLSFPNSIDDRLTLQEIDDWLALKGPDNRLKYLSVLPWLMLMSDPQK